MRPPARLSILVQAPSRPSQPAGPSGGKVLQVPAQREGAAAWTQARKPLRGGPGPRLYPQPSAARPGPGGLVRGPVEIIIVAVIMCGHVPHAGQLVSAAPRPSVHILSNAPCSSLQVRLRDAQGSAKATQLGPEARVCAHRSPPVPPPTLRSRATGVGEADGTR